MPRPHTSYLLSAVFSASFLLLAGCASGTGNSGGGSSSPTPTSLSITAVSPTHVSAGSSDVTLDVNGTGFSSGTVVSVNSITETTTFVSSTEVRATVPATQLKVGAVLTVAVTDGSNVVKADPAAISLSVDNPAPVITAVSPMALSAGSDATTLIVTGTGFVNGSTVQINGTTHTSAYVSATEVDVPLSATELASSGSLSMTVTNAQPGGGTSPAAAVAVNNPVPSIASLSPTNIDVGSADTAVTVTGTGFLPLTTLQINGSAHSVAYKTSKQMVVTLTAAELASAANDNLVLANAAPGGGSSSAATLTVSYPAPVITSLSPASVTVGSAATTVTITGTGFLSTSTVQALGTTRSAASYVSGTQMTVPLSAADLASSGTYPIGVTNPAGYGGASKTATFTVQAKTPVLSTVTPTTVAINSGSYAIVAAGSNFSIASKLLWNGTQLTTTYTSTYVYNNGVYTYIYMLVGVVPQELLTTPGSASVTVSTPTAASVSNALTISITNPPAPSITSISPNAVPVKADANISVSGSGFAKSSVVSYNGTPLTTTFNNNASLSVTVPARMLAIAGNGSITVSTPAPGGGTSTAAALTAYLPVVSNNMVFNPVNGLAYLSIPSTGSTVTGNSIVSFDPATGALGNPIFVGSEPNAMAVSDDGKTLWVALNGTFAIRKVDLVSGVAGAQYSIASLGYSYLSSAATAILVLPGTTDSVAVTNGYGLGIFDSGVLRGSTVSVSSVYGLQADQSRSELYTGTSYNVQAYTYNSSGLTLKSSGNSNYSSYVTSSTFDEMQLGSGKMFTDYGRVFDPESGGLLGSFTSGTNNITGPTLYDAGLSQVYVLTNSSGTSYSSYTQVSLYNPTDYSNTNKSFAWNVPYSITDANNNTDYLNPHRLTRWGANGLLLHTKYALFTTQSNVIKDQSTVLADLSVSITASGGTATGSTATYTATVTNNGPQSATDVALAVQAPSTGIVTAASSSSGSCQSLTGCNLGTLAANASATITVKVLQTTAGTGTLYETVLASSTDPDASNNTATSSVVVTGNTYNLVPALTSISPNAVKTGSSDTTITVTGSNFASGSQVMLGTTALSTKFVSGTQLTATVPSANLTSMGWSAVSVSTPTPGGGSSNSMPFTVFNVVTVGLNHVIYEPYTRKLFASVSSGSSSVTGSSIVSIDPTTGTFGTPITFATAPTTLALSSSGRTLYTPLTVPSSSTLTSVPFGQVDVVNGIGNNTSIVTPYGFYGGFPVVNAAVQPGTENVLAVSRVNALPTIYDYDGSAKTLTPRPNTGSVYYSTCITFLDANNLLSTYSSTIDYTVTSTGLGSYNSLTYPSECFQLSGNTAAAASGKFYNITSSAASPSGLVVLPSSYGTALPALDTALGSAFFAGNTSSSTSYGNTDGLISYDVKTFLRTGSIFLNIPTIEGSTSSSTISDIVRWGQDGLALVTSSGHLYLLRGPFVVPQELATNSAATLTSSSATTITAGSNNTLLTITGSNFMPGIAVTWNGSYRTTTFVDATHVTVAVPAVDLATAGSGKLVATNPGATGSNALTVTVQ